MACRSVVAFLQSYMAGAPMIEPKLRLALIEDDRDLAEVTQAALEAEGFDVDVAYDGQEGLDLIARTMPDVVITDVVMPVLDGLQLIQQLFSSAARHPPVIAISAIGSRLHLAREMGACEALVKPVEPQELAAVARKCWRRFGQ
jgi:DNA-binding response OmpR family regulator